VFDLHHPHDGPQANLIAWVVSRERETLSAPAAHRLWKKRLPRLRNFVLLLLLLPTALAAQQFGGARRVEVPMAYPYTAVGKWTSTDGGTRVACTAFFVNRCTLVTAARCAAGRTSDTTRFEASDGQRFQIHNIQRTAGKVSDEFDLEVAFGQVVARPGQKLADEKYGHFAFDKADTVAAISGFTPHCSYGFSNNQEGKGGRGTLDPDVYVWGSARQVLKDKIGSDEYFLHMTNSAFGASGSPIFRCTPTIIDGKFLSVDVGAPTRLVGVLVRISNEKDTFTFADRLRVEPRHMALGIGGQQFFPELAEYVKKNPCEGR